MKSKQLRSFLLGGILPVVVFTLIEEYYGTFWGLIAGMILGAGEILWEWRTQKKVDPLTWGGNGLLLILGGVSLFTQEGLWFKLQPAFLEGCMALALWISVVLKKPLLLLLAQKQGGLPAHLPEKAMKRLKQAFLGLTFRIGAFFAVHAGLATWAALYWSTSAWALLKGVGLTVSLIVYMVVESLILRYRLSQSHEQFNE